MVVTPDLLKSFPLLKKASITVLEMLAQHSSLQKVARRGIVLSAGKQEEHLCFLFEGRLQGVDFTIDGREVGLYFVEPGDYCGEIGLFDRGPQPEFVIALTSAMVVMVPMDAFRASHEPDPRHRHRAGHEAGRSGEADDLSALTAGAAKYTPAGMLPALGANTSEPIKNSPAVQLAIPQHIWRSPSCSMSAEKL